MSEPIWMSHVQWRPRAVALLHQAWSDCKEASDSRQLSINLKLKFLNSELNHFETVKTSLRFIKPRCDTKLHSTSSLSMSFNGCG